MTESTIGIVVLAAGQGTRMRLNMPKPLAPIQGKTLIDFVLSSLPSTAPKR